MGCEKVDAEKMLLTLKAAGSRPSRVSRAGGPRPQTFAFRGFTHYCGRTRDGRFIVKHKTEGKRPTRKQTALRQEVWRFMHVPPAMQYERLAAVLRGHQAIMVDRTTIQSSTASTGKWVGPGCAV